ncbi:MAG TPA: STAS domain-containing protein [Gaiellaceae bacterium]|nr:STAS domain-containing protein [Gaiellaceae bacterium]
MKASVRTRQIGSATYRIALAGEFDMFTAPEFRHDLHSCIEHGATEVIVDLGGATFIDSTFLGVLLGGMRSLRERGGEIRVACPDSLRKIFEITGLDRVLTITQAPAVAAETIA